MFFVPLFFLHFSSPIHQSQYSDDQRNKPKIYKQNLTQLYPGIHTAVALKETPPRYLLASNDLIHKLLFDNVQITLIKIVSTKNFQQTFLISDQIQFTTSILQTEITTKQLNITDQIQHSRLIIVKLLVKKSLILFVTYVMFK